MEWHVLLCLLLHLLLIVLPSDGQRRRKQDSGRSRSDAEEDSGESGHHSHFNRTGHLDGLGRLLFAPVIVADTKLGRVRGIRVVSRVGHPFYQFRGIPYAVPPVGDLRFEPPQPHEGWRGTREAAHFRNECLQLSVVTQRTTGNEDCLYLNVYTRKTYRKNELSSVSKEDLHPVIVFIHGGLFMFGSSHTFGGRYFLDEKVVLVTINYRLASLGFLNTGNELIKGNMGLKDQTMALKWVQNNIKFFNGDPKRVTIVGESAGSVCAHLHTLSPMSRGLFSGVISQSGTALSPWGLIDDVEVQAEEFAEGLGCPTDHSVDMVKCLKELPARKIAQYHKGYIKALSQDKHSLFGPTVEAPHNGTVFLPDSPLNLLQRGSVSKKPWITGVNSAEGLVFLIPIMRNEEIRKLLNSNWEQYAPTVLNLRKLRPKRRSQLSNEAKSHYLQDEPITEDNLKEAAKMFSDRHFFLDNHDAAILQSKKAPTYVYYYGYEGRFSLGNLLFSRTPLPLPDDVDYMTGAGLNWVILMAGLRRKSKLGVCHGDEMPLLFNMLVRGEVHQFDSDYRFSRKLIKLWVSFAETGKPDVSRANGNVTWEPVHRTNRDLRDVPLKYLSINKKFSIIDEPFHEGIQFWKNNSISNL